jgi:hypothetical protein
MAGSDAAGSITYDKSLYSFLIRRAFVGGYFWKFFLSFSIYYKTASGGEK